MQRSRITRDSLIRRKPSDKTSPPIFKLFMTQAAKKVRKSVTLFYRA